MFCRNCGKEVPVHAQVCLSCGVRPQNGNSFCQACAAQTDPQAVVCVKCGRALVPCYPPMARSRLAAGLLGIFLGGFGVHRFYLGFTGIGIAQIAVTFVTCGFGSLWGFIEGILYIAGAMNTDAEGNLLRE